MVQRRGMIMWLLVLLSAGLALALDVQHHSLGHLAPFDHQHVPEVALEEISLSTWMPWGGPPQVIT